MLKTEGEKWDNNPVAGASSHDSSDDVEQGGQTTRNDDDTAGDGSQEIDIEDMLLKIQLEPLFLPNLIHDSAWNEVRRILDTSTVSEEAMDTILHAKDGDGDNVLNVALYKRAPRDILHKLVSLGRLALVQEQNSSNQTSLHYACRYQASVDIVRELIDIGGDNLVFLKDKEEMTPLHNACLRKDGSKDVVKLLIEKGGQDLITATDEDGFTALHYACRGNAPSDIVQLLIDHGPENLVFRSTNQGWTALHHACANDATVDVIELLVHVGKKRLVLQNTNETDDEPERNALDLACMYHDDPAVIETVLTCAGDDLLESNRHEVTTSLFLLCAIGAPANMITPFLLRGGKEILAERRANNISVLHAACSTADARLETIEALLKFGGRALLFAEDASGRKVIHYAMEHDIDFDIFKLLLKKGRYDLAISRNRKQNNALHMICSKTPLEAIKLIAAYSSITCFQKNADGDTPLDCLLKHNSDFAPKHIHLLQDIMYENDRAGSTISTNTLTALRGTPDENSALILRGKYIRSALNHLSITPAVLMVITLDFVTQIIIIWKYSFDIDQNTSNGSDSDDTHAFNLFSLPDQAFYFSFGWIIFRELTQINSSNFWTYVSDPSNIIDLIQIGLISAIEAGLNASFQKDTLLHLLISSIGISWIRLIFVFSNMIYSMKVFVSALVSITKKLVPFLYVTIIIIMAFAHMYYVAGPPPNIQCPSGTESTLNNNEYFEGGWACELKHSYFKSFSMLVTGEFPFFDELSGVRSTLSIIFAIVIGIVLLNIIIAVINESFVKDEANSESAFWLGRLHLVNEFIWLGGSIRSVLFLTIGKSWKDRPSRHRFSPNWGGRDIYEWISYENCYKLLDWYNGGSSNKPTFYTRLSTFFKVAQWTEIIPPSEGFRKVIAGVRRREKIAIFSQGISAWILSSLVFLVVCALIPIIFYLGLMTGGIFWPIEFKEFLFFGPLESKQVKVKNNDVGENTLKEFRYAIESSLTEFKNELSKELSKDQKKILDLLHAVTAME